MMDYNQERKLKMILDMIPDPQQPRDEQGRYTEKKQEELKSDLDKVTWVPAGDGVFIRRRKARYMIYDLLFISGLIAAFAWIL
jgi:hypothetical protein